jgi:hypothetical protein
MVAARFFGGTGSSLRREWAIPSEGMDRFFGKTKNSFRRNASGPAGLACDRVVGVRRVPQRDQIVVALADVLAVLNLAAEGARLVEAVLDGVVGAAASITIPIKTNLAGKIQLLN